jgi:hypothetical protein
MKEFSTNKSLNFFLNELVETETKQLQKKLLSLDILVQKAYCEGWKTNSKNSGLSLNDDWKLSDCYRELLDIRNDT